MTTASVDRFALLTDRERRAAEEFVHRVRQRFDGQAVTIVLFGSRARGDAAPNSDMDLLVVMLDASPSIRREVRDLATEVWLKYGIYLSTRVLSQASWRELEALQTGLYCNICKDGIDLWTHF